MFRKFSMGVLVVLVFALVLGGIVSAQGPADDRTRGRWLAPIAEKLEMTVEELQAALDAGQTIQELAQAKGVELVRDQPDEWRKRELGWPDRLGDRFPRGGASLAPIAEKLGMTVEELQAAIDAGQTLQELAEAKGVDLTFRNRPDGARGRGLWGGKDGVWLAPTAEKLGMTVEELQAALDAGQTIQELAQAKGVELGWPDRPGGWRDRTQREDKQRPGRAALGLGEM